MRWLTMMDTITNDNEGRLDAAETKLSGWEIRGDLECGPTLIMTLTLLPRIKGAVIGLNGPPGQKGEHIAARLAHVGSHGRDVTEHVIEDFTTEH
jgi:hypothetical protein